MDVLFLFFEIIKFASFSWLGAGFLPLLILMYCIVVSTLWFLLPLLTLSPLNIEESRKIARWAEQINEWAIFVATYTPLIFISILLVLTELSIILNLLYLPFFSIYMYITYRHVFLGRKENYPIVEKSVEAIDAEPAVN